jgi:hypothetical protein
MINLSLARAFKFFLIALAVIGFSTITYAYAASNVVLASKAGDGRGTINGYSVVSTSIYYTLNANNPQNIDSVAFTTTTDITAGSTVRIKLVSAGSTWYACTVAGGRNVSCITSGATVGTADSLRVVIAD